MTRFIDLRATPSGGFVAPQAKVFNSDDANERGWDALQRDTRGRHVVLVTHGFNVSGAAGTEAIGRWRSLCQLPADCVWVGVLWPGDSGYIPVIDYPIEGSVAISSGRLLARVIDEQLTGATRISLVSHSLGARTVLEAVRTTQRERIATLILMAGAIEDDCLTAEYSVAAAKVERLVTVASERDFVLRFAFAIGNPVGEILMRGHPYFRQALGLDGPSSAADVPAPIRTWQGPTGWDYGHLDYMPHADGVEALPQPINLPSTNAAAPGAGTAWKAAWSAAVIGTELSSGSRNGL